MTTSELFVTTANGFSRVTDSASNVILLSVKSPATSDAEFSLGFEIEGATGPRWIAYLLETARSPGKTVQPPTPAPWVVRRVIPGSPAAKADLRPGDRITHFEGEPITDESNPLLFRKLASIGDPALRGFDGPMDMAKAVQLRVDRSGAEKPLEMKLPRAGYAPESVFGVTRRDDGSWDYLLDRDAKIGYIRVGAIERETSAVEFERALTGLTREGAEALILDLRWSPGGYVVPITQITGAFLPPGKTVAALQGRANSQPDQRGYYTELPPGRKEWNKLPLAVLVNGETIGGGEIIASALQDHGRAIVIGQRTFGRGVVMEMIENVGSNRLGFRVGKYYTLRPNGKNRHRLPDSKPTDDWGVRPDKGFEVPLTPEVSARLRTEAERHAIRPAGSTEVVAFDDPLEDPQRMVAMRLLKEKLKADEKKKDSFVK